MNEIMISIKPEWCRKIMTGQKTAEVRRTKPKLNTPFKCLIYCTKDAKSNELYKGQVVAEFVCDKIFNIDAGNNLRLEVIEYKKDKNYTQNLIYGKVVETTADLQKAVEEARDVMKEYNGGEMLVMDVTTFYDEQVSRWSA